MSTVVPMQAFQIGQRVQVKGQQPFVIRSIFLGWDEVLRYGGNIGYDCFEANKLTLAPGRPPYVPSDRRTVSCLVTVYRCETDAELAARHAVERAEYEE